MLRVVANELVDLLNRGSAGTVHLGGVDDESRESGETVEQGRCGAWEGHGCGVVRHPCPDADGRFASVAKCPFDRRLYPGGDVEGRVDETNTGGELGGGCGRTERHRSRMGRGCGERAEQHTHAHTELVDELHQRFGESIPAEVGLGPGEDEYVLARAVATVAELQSWPFETGVDAIHETHHGPPGALVEQFVGVEADKSVGADLALQVAHRGCCAETGVDPSVEGDHQHRVAKTLWDVVFPCCKCACHSMLAIPEPLRSTGDGRRRFLRCVSSVEDGPRVEDGRQRYPPGMGYIDVTDATFQEQVVAKSATVPVIIDLWAPWCGPCRTLGPIIERVVDATGGQVVLAKVNVDENPRIGQVFQVQSIPAVFAVKDGKIADSFIGALPEAQVAAWVAGLVPAKSKADQMIDDGLERGDEAMLRSALALEPANVRGVVALAEMLVGSDRAAEALQLLARIPETSDVQRVAALARLGVAPSAENDDTVAELEVLLDGVKGDEGQRQRYVDLLALMGDDPRVPDLRRRLTARLF